MFVKLSPSRRTGEASSPEASLSPGVDLGDVTDWGVNTPLEGSISRTRSMSPKFVTRVGAGRQRDPLGSVESRGDVTGDPVGGNRHARGVQCVSSFRNRSSPDRSFASQRAIRDVQDIDARAGEPLDEGGSIAVPGRPRLDGIVGPDPLGIDEGLHGEGDEDEVDAPIAELAIEIDDRRDRIGERLARDSDPLPGKLRGRRSRNPGPDAISISSR